MYKEIRDAFLQPRGDLAAKRMAICQTCDYYQRKYSRCMKCGCILPVKTRIPGMKCPISKW